MSGKELGHLSSGQMRDIDQAIEQGATLQQLAKKYGVDSKIIGNVVVRKGESTMAQSKEPSKPTPKTDPEPQPEPATGAEQPPEQPPDYSQGDRPPWAPGYDDK